jgi:hypothetical protein
MRMFLWILGGFVIGAAVALGVCVALPYVVPISQAEGAYAMGVVFFWMPLGAVTGALAGMVIRLLRRG